MKKKQRSDRVDSDEQDLTDDELVESTSEEFSEWCETESGLRVSVQWVTIQRDEYRDELNTLEEEVERPFVAKVGCCSSR